jgi:uncharacterized protein (DUF2132 family)
MHKIKYVAIPKKIIFKEIRQDWSHKKESAQSRFCAEEAPYQAKTLAEIVDQLISVYGTEVNDFRFGLDCGDNFLSVTFLRKNPFVKNPEAVDLNYLNLFREGIVNELWECTKIFEIQKTKKIDLTKEARLLGLTT